VREVKLYELGPVVFPAYVETTAMVRSLRAAAPTVFERTEDLAPGDEPEGADENTGTTELPADDGTSEVPAEESNGDSAERSHSPDPMSHAERKHYVRQLVARDLRAER
jgi:hypothetical protein